MAKITTVKTFTIPQGEIERLIFNAINTPYVTRSIKFEADLDLDGNVVSFKSVVTITTDQIEKKISE